MALRDQPPPVSSHYLSQTGLAVALGLAVRRAWGSLNYTQAEASLPTFTEQLAALVNRLSLVSSALAAREYERRRVAAGIRSGFTVPLAPPPNAEQVDRSLSWATRQLRNGDLVDLHGDTLTKQIDTVRVTVTGVTEKLVLDSGRTTIVDAVQADRHARAWAREARPDCCYFCAMLAGRGAVYKSEFSAGKSSGEGTGPQARAHGESYHDHCRCQAIPVFNVYEPSAHARQWAAEWRQLKNQGGPVSLLAWRQHYEGRADN